MNVLKPLGRYLSRKRHARGFGIHSPFAFSFVCKVLGEKAGYYAYNIIERKAAQLKHSREGRPLSVGKLKMLFRVVNYFRPDTIIAAGHIGEEVFPALLEPDSRTVVVGLTPGLASAGEYGCRITRQAKKPPTPTSLTVVGTVDDHAADAAAEVAALAIRVQCPVILLDASHKAGPKILQACRAAMTRGMIFHNDGRIAIIIPRMHLPRQDFRISL